MERQEVGTVTESIAMAFNLGVWMRQTEGEKSIFEIGKELEQIIYWSMFQTYGDKYPDELIRANVDYLLQVAVLGYILPKVCAPDEELKSRLIGSIEAKIYEHWSGQNQNEGIVPTFKTESSINMD